MEAKNMTIYPSEPSLPARPHCFCHAVPVHCSPTNAGAQPSLRSSLFPYLRTGLRNQRWCSKRLQGRKVVILILMWFVTSLLPFSSCQGATSPVITGVFLIRLNITACQGHTGLGMGGSACCCIHLIMINTHLLNTWAIQGQAKGGLWLPLFHTIAVTSCFKKQSCIVSPTFLNTCVAAPTPSSYLCLPFWNQNCEPVIYKS